MSILYIDCFSGISGDMFVAACLDLGVSIEELKEELLKLPVKGYKIEIKKAMRSGISAYTFLVEVLEPQPFRTAKEIFSLLRESDLDTKVKEDAQRIFQILADAEAKVHGVERDQVHFHEIGAVDSIVDIVSAAFCLHRLGGKEVVSSPVPLSRGTVDSVHGTLPLPAPATLEVLRGTPVYGTGWTHETVTPTGAAILKAFSKGFGPIPPMLIKRVGIGAGQREVKGLPNVLRLIVGEPLGGLETDTIVEIKTNIDDRAPYELGALLEELMKKGALDVSMIPCYMKKNRPGVQIQVLARPGDLSQLSQVILNSGISPGLRYNLLPRLLLVREQKTCETPWGMVRIKLGKAPNGRRLIWPEYEDMKEIQNQKNIPIWEIKAWILAHANQE